MRLFEILQDLPEIMKEAESIAPNTSLSEDSDSDDEARESLASLMKHCREFELSITA